MATKTTKKRTNAKKTTAKKKTTTQKAASTKKTTTKKTAVKKTAAKKTTAKKTTAKKTTAKKTAAKKTAAKKSAVKKTAAKKTTAKKTAVKKAPAKKATAKKTTAKKTAVKKAPAKKTTAKKAPVKKAEPKKATPIEATSKEAAADKVENKTPKKSATKSAPTKVQETNVIDIRKAQLTISKKAKDKVKDKPKLQRKVELPPEPVADLNIQPSIASTIGVMGISPYQPTGSEEYMGDRMTEHFRSILNTWKASLMEEVDRTLNHMQDEAANFPDPNDRATQEEEFSLALRNRDRERRLLSKINKALDKIEREDDYGYCEACGVEIGVRRLEARPTAELCIDCKTLEEIKEKQNHR